jgi:hypothetical protein
MEAPQAPTGTRPNQQAIRAFLGMLGGKDFDTESLIGKERRLLKTERLDGGRIIKHFTDGTSEVTDDIGESKSKERYDEATGLVYQSFATGPNAGKAMLVTNEDGTPLRLTPSEANARGIGRGKAEGEAIGKSNTADIAAETEAKIEAARKKATMDTEHRLNAKYALPGAQALTAQTERDVNLLLNNKEGLKQIVGSKLTARLSTLGTENAIAGLYAGGIHAGTPMANAFAAHMQLTSKAFLDSYRDAYKGTGPVSNVEGLKGAQSNLQQALYQTQDVYEQRLREYIEQIRLKEAQLAAAGLDPVSPQYAPAASGGASMDGWKIERE